MPKIKKTKLLENDIIEEFDYVKTKDRVLEYFYRYRSFKRKVDLIGNEYNSCLSNVGNNTTSNIIKKNDITAKKAEKILIEKEYIEKINKSLKGLKYKLTSDEKVILEYCILSTNTDEFVAEALFLEKCNIYKRKKSCFIKVALYYGLEVLK